MYECVRVCRLRVALAHQIFEDIEFIDSNYDDDDNGHDSDDDVPSRSFSPSTTLDAKPDVRSSRESPKNVVKNAAANQNAAKPKAKSRYVIKRPAPPPPTRNNAGGSHQNKSLEPNSDEKRVKSKAPQPPPTMPKPHKTIEGYWRPKEQITAAAAAMAAESNSNQKADKMSSSMIVESSTSKSTSVSQNIRKAFSLKERVKPPSLYPRPLIRPDPKPSSHSFFPSPRSKRSSRENAATIANKSPTGATSENIPKHKSKAATLNPQPPPQQRSSVCDNHQSDKYSRLSKEMITGPVHLLDKASQEKYLGEVADRDFVVSPSQWPSRRYNYNDDSGGALLESTVLGSIKTPCSLIDVASSSHSCKIFLCQLII